VHKIGHDGGYCVKDRVISRSGAQCDTGTEGMSRAMLERYSHIRMAAKRNAVEALSLTKSA
jgi:hypothetical protein